MAPLAHFSFFTATFFFFTLRTHKLFVYLPCGRLRGVPHLGPGPLLGYIYIYIYKYTYIYIYIYIYISRSTLPVCVIPRKSHNRLPAHAPPPPCGGFISAPIPREHPARARSLKNIERSYGNPTDKSFGKNITFWNFYPRVHFFKYNFLIF